jgi:hypothetical protein
MTVSFYVEVDDLYLLEKYIEDYNEDEDQQPVYYSNTPASPTQVMASLTFYEFNELVDLELLIAL